jgi:hypothetical protein
LAPTWSREGERHNKVKIEASAFRGREPDQHRYDIEAPGLDSVATRLSWNPIPDLSAQVSWGYLKSPEQLQPNVNENRITASLIYNKPFDDNNWATTFAWGRKINHPGNTSTDLVAGKNPGDDDGRRLGLPGPG